jgi:hypothetical protein
MKKQILTVAAVLFLTALVPKQSHAQYATKANIPFSFQAGSARMPAGEYQVRQSPTGGGTQQMISRTDSSAATFVLTNVADSRHTSGNPKLIFHCYSNDCFLSEIWNGSGQGWKLLESRREKELSRAAVENELASLSVPLTVKP